MNRIAKYSGRGFSLVELLVGITIGALLAGLGVPAIQGAMAKGKQAACASNMRQIGQGILLYAGENNGRLPDIFCGGEDEDASWIKQLQPYLGTNYARVRICPADPKAGAKLQQNDATSYLLTERVKADAFADENGELVPGEVVFDHLMRIPKPSRAILMFLGNTNKTSRHDDHIHVGVMGSWSGVRGEIWPDAFGGGSRDGTRGSANYLFADGHVQNIAAATLKQRVESGQDITVEF
jgi:prepilin-type processing-associated H-X9-DG protein/prepilin-type N-terminal cleavage/methylation domain-containing protein